MTGIFRRSHIVRGTTGAAGTLSFGVTTSKRTTWHFTRPVSLR